MDLNQSLVEANELFEAQAHIYRHVLNYTTSMSLGCALELGIPDIIHNHGKPITIQELVSKLNIPIEKTLHLQRLMRFLIHSNFFSLTKLHDQEDEGYILTTASKSWNPRMTCTVFDLLHVVADKIDTRNLKYVGGDMFSSIPSADVIFFKLKNVLHNWTDDNVLKILKRCRETIRLSGDKGKVIMIDIVLDEAQDRHEITETKMVFDVLMMVLVTGRERTKVEWEQLFLEAGFSQCKITPNFGMRSVMEVLP
ncbi:trans-resveratrol di-O-methyltransferase-like [Bidens hawaiensis]|uniref:trans-resveratrol di-O-methyltransferase-like n=1 Tax=Bidens hawaiensis TaxID=980011 RepID=UPI00404A5440